jgi:hypothetical protein
MMQYSLTKSISKAMFNLIHLAIQLSRPHSRCAVEVNQSTDGREMFFFSPEDFFAQRHRRRSPPSLISVKLQASLPRRDVPRTRLSFLPMTLPSNNGGTIQLLALLPADRNSFDSLRTQLFLLVQGSRRRRVGLSSVAALGSGRRR